jgi:hypothetical protein
MLSVVFAEGSTDLESFIVGSARFKVRLGHGWYYTERNYDQETFDRLREVVQAVFMRDFAVVITPRRARDARPP